MSVPIPPAAPVAAPPIAGPVAAPQASGGPIAQLTRLVGWVLFLAWRRRGMVITLMALLLAGYLVTQLFLWLSWASFSEINAQQPFAEALSFPLAASFAGGVYKVIGTLLLIVLAGALIGSEYAYGTHRLSLARGVGRGQFLTAQVIALAILALISSAALILIGALLGVIGGLITGGGEAISAAGIGELMVFWLAVALNAFAYAVVALWIGTIGRSVAGAIAGPLIYVFVEFVVAGVLSVFQNAVNPDALTRLLAAIPDYMLGPNAEELVQLSGQTPYKLLFYSGHVGETHALVMVALYCALFIGSAYFIFRLRDVRE
jgi:ABC-2 type transport system permease protein